MKQELGYGLRASDEEEEDSTMVTPAPPRDHAQSSPPPPRTARSRTYSRPRRDRDQPRPRGRPAATPRPRYSSAAAAAAASQANDGYKPREERSWEDFHPDLDIEADLMVFTADEVDGKAKREQRPSLLSQDTSATNGEEQEGSAMMTGEADQTHVHESDALVVSPVITPKRRPGRPPRRPESMLSGLGSPPAPRILPLPTHNPKERLNLPKPSFRKVDTFRIYEADKKTRIEDFVDKAMAHVGYQESERFDVPDEILIRHAEGPPDDDMGAGLILESDERPEHQAPPQVGDVEYDMDEQDERWLEGHNSSRKEEQVDPIKPAIFEITMTQIEREYYALEKRIPKPNPRHTNPTRPRSSSAAAVNGEPAGSGDEPDSKCAICDDGDCENANAIIFCDGCDLAVHQECYGVPFIPEGQWFCRKCKEIGRGTPTCIFCPNIDGAFKQTNTLRWSHLLCAIWIPEVSIANLTFMEPVQDVEKVPRGRWSLVCYICNQRMGACIQCGNKACYQAFHVTCARRARLFLKMKSTHAGGIDASVLKAFCDRHVPSEWRRDHDVDNAIVDAKRYYRRTMRDRQWADSQTAALAMGSHQLPAITDAPDELGQADETGTIVVANNKRKKKDTTKTGWRLPSGAPVVPAVVFNAVEASLARFMLRKRKDFVAEACKYWTLKREARRGAALLKRLQLQLESFSSMEITRRNFVGMGAAGRPRLLRRIEFADMLTQDMTRLEEIIGHVTEREQVKLEDVENLQKLINSVYFPMSDLLWPVLRKAQKLDEKTRFFTAGLDKLESKLSERFYTSVSAFSLEVAAVFAPALTGSDADPSIALAHDVSEMHNQVRGPMTLEQRQALSAEQKQQKVTAKRIIKACKELLEDTLKKEAELKGVPYENEIKGWEQIDARLDGLTAEMSERGSVAASVLDGELGKKRPSDASAIGGASPSDAKEEDVTMADVPSVKEEDNSGTNDDASANHKRNASATMSILSKAQQPTQAPSPPISAASSSAQEINPQTATSDVAIHTDGVTGAHSAAAPMDPWSVGGVPWYMRPFDPVGTTVHEERWTGMDQIRAMSEPLSDMDEATLNELNPLEDGPETSEVKPVAKTTAKRNKRASTATNGNANRRSGRRGSGKAMAGADAEDEADPQVEQDEEPAGDAEMNAKDANNVKATKAKTPRATRRKTQTDGAKSVDTPPRKRHTDREKMDAYNAKRRAERKNKKAAAS